MFSKYFEELEKNILKKTKTGETNAKGKGNNGTKGKSGKKYDDLVKNFNNIIPSHLKLGSAMVVDSSGYTPDDVDFVAYREIYRDLIKMMDDMIAPAMYSNDIDIQKTHLKVHYKKLEHSINMGTVLLKGYDKTLQKYK